jgi:hypothetical protein
MLPKLNPIRVTETEPDVGFVAVPFTYSRRGAAKVITKVMDPRGAPFEI